MFSWMREWIGYKPKPIMTKIQWEGYCFKCRCKRVIDNPITTVWANGRETRQGGCVYCGTQVSVISGQRLGKA